MGCGLILIHFLLTFRYTASVKRKEGDYRRVVRTETLLCCVSCFGSGRIIAVSKQLEFWVFFVLLARQCCVDCCVLCCLSEFTSSYIIVYFGVLVFNM